MVYTTEKQEKEALKLYMQLLHSDYRTAVETFVRDWKLSGITKSLDFHERFSRKEKYSIINIHNIRLCIDSLHSSYFLFSCILPLLL